MTFLPQFEYATYPSQIFWGSVVFFAFWIFTHFYVVPRIAKLHQARNMRSCSIEQETKEILQKIVDYEAKTTKLIRESDQRIADAHSYFFSAVSKIRSDSLKKIQNLDQDYAIKINTEAKKYDKQHSEKLFTTISEIVRNLHGKDSAVNAAIKIIKTQNN